MSNPFYTHNTPFQSGTTVRADAVNAKFDALETAFDLTSEQLALTLTLHPDAVTGSTILPNMTLANSLLWFDTNNNLSLYSLATLDASIDSAAQSASASDSSAQQALLYSQQALAHVNNAAQSDILAQKFAQESIDVEVLPGQYSAFHWSKKSMDQVVLASDQVALASEQVALASEQVVLAQDQVSSATQQSSLSEQWASGAEDNAVQNGQYSAFHWAQKAKSVVTQDLDQVFLKIEDAAKTLESHYINPNGLTISRLTNDSINIEFTKTTLSYDDLTGNVTTDIDSTFSEGDIIVIEKQHPTMNLTINITGGDTAKSSLGTVDNAIIFNDAAGSFRLIKTTPTQFSIFIG